MTARDRQVQADRVFLATNRAQLTSGNAWAMRGSDGQLHVMPHTSVATDMFRAVDRSLRVEGGRDSADYLQGGVEGAAASLTGTVNGLIGFARILTSATTSPVQSLNRAAGALRASNAGSLAVEFSRSSNEIVAAGVRQALQEVERAHRDPRTAGRFHGRAGAEMVQMTMPSWPAILFRGTKRVVEAADVGADLMKGASSAADTLTDVPLTSVPATTWTNRVVVPAAGQAPTTGVSVADKLERYLLNPDHPVGGPKAKWFKEALGFTRANADELAAQIRFNPSSAVQTSISAHGVKFNQVIRIVGANNREIDVTFAWIRNNDGVVRLVTSIPTSR